jgi:hypothetical protein
MSSVTVCQWRSKVSVTAALTVSAGRFCCKTALPLESTTDGRGGSSVSGGINANDNEITAPAATVTPLAASNCFGCMAAIRQLSMR